MDDQDRDPRQPARDADIDVDCVLEIGTRWLRATGRDLVEELHAARRRERACARARRP